MGGYFARVLRPIHPALAEHNTFRQALFIMGTFSLTLITAGGLRNNFRMLFGSPVDSAVASADPPPLSKDASDKLEAMHEAPSLPTPPAAKTSDPIPDMRRDLERLRSPVELEADRIFREKTQLRREIQIARGQLRDVQVRRDVLQAKVDILEERIQNKRDKAERERSAAEAKKASSETRTV